MSFLKFLDSARRKLPFRRLDVLSPALLPALSFCLSIGASLNVTQAEEWAQFRGAKNNGVAPESSAPAVSWGSSDFRYQTELPGVGWSSPVYQANYVWMTSAITTPATKAEIDKKKEGVQFAQIKTSAGTIELKAICVEIDSGKIVHDLSLLKVEDPELINPMNSYASPTPAISNGKVVCHFGSYGTWCIDEASGSTVWNKAYVVDHSVGPGSSAFIHNGQVILVCDGIDTQFVVSVDLENGSEVWRTNRPPMRSKNGEKQKAYSTPLIIEVDGKEQAVIPGAQWIVAYDPASGKEIWRADHGDGFSVTPMAVYESGLVVFSTGYMAPEYVAVDPTGTGDVTETHIKWRARNAPTMPSFVGFDGRIFAISDKGILSCLDAKTGEMIERKRIGGNFSASPLLAGGNLYLSSREGVVSVVHASNGLEIVATNKFESPILASPAVIGNDLLIRTEKKIYRIKN